MHTVIIGGGIIGLTTAYHLAREGGSVSVIDQRATGRGASDVNAGWVCPAESAPAPGPGMVLAALKWMTRPDSPLYIRPPLKPDFLAFMLGMFRASNAKAQRADFVSAFGSAPFMPAPDLTTADLSAAFEGKVLSQLNLVRVGLDHVADRGSITLTTGVLAREAVPTGAAAAMANGAVESFVMAAAGELPRGVRLNAVSPSILASAPGYFDAFPGFEPVSDARVGQAFVR